MVIRRLVGSMVAGFLFLPGVEARSDPQASAAVVVDLVVRDKKGAPVADLTAGEIEVHEDGAKQAVEVFRRVGADANPKVVLVFPRLPSEERVLAQSAAEEFVKKQLGTDISAAVYRAGTDLAPVQDFTADPAALKAAVKRALDDDAKVPVKVGFLDIRLLFGLVDRLGEVPGRKTAMLFCSGLALPVGAEGIVETLAGAANRSRVTFYGIDPRGVQLAGPGMKLTEASEGVSQEVWIR